MLLTIFLGVICISVLSLCPNRCSGHGRCIDNKYCECDSLMNKNSKDWYGPDCSQRACPSDLSFAAINEVQNRRADSQKDISISISRNLKSRREKSNIKPTDSPNPEIISSNRIGNTNIFNITTEIPYSFGNTSLGSEIECYYRNNKSLIGRGRIVDYNYEKPNENYVIFDFPIYNDTNPTDFLCHLTFLFTDYSLINPQQPIYEDDIISVMPRNYFFYNNNITLHHYYVIWKNMDFVLQKLYVNSNNRNTGRIACMYKKNSTEINGSPFVYSLNISESSKISVYDPKDVRIEFEMKYRIEDVSKVMCYLYMNKEGEIFDDLSDYTRVYQTVVTEKFTDRNLLFDHQDIYKIPAIYINPKPDKYNEEDTTVNYMNREEPIKDIGELLCYIRGSLYPQPSYLLGKADPHEALYYYILYDFDISTTVTTIRVSPKKYKKARGIVPSLQFCYMKRLYSDLSLYYPTQITSCESSYMCPVIWYGIYPIFQNALPMTERSSSSFSSESFIGYMFDNTVINFACIDLLSINNNNKEYNVELYPYQLPLFNWCDPPENMIFESLLLNAKSAPVGKVCHGLIDSKMRRLKIEDTELYKQHLIPTKMIQGYVYYKYFPLYENLYSNVYKVIGYYNYLSSNIKYRNNNDDFNGGILECYIRDTNDYVGDVYVIFQSDDSNKYTYILYPNSTYSKVKPTPNNTRCDLISVHDDFTRYIPPIEIEEEMTMKLVIKDIGYFMKMIGYLNFENNNRTYEFGCVSKEKKDEMKIYQFSLTTTDEEISQFNETSPFNLTFQLMSFTNKLNKGDKCYILSHFDGRRIKDIKNSDLKKKYDITIDNKHKKVYNLKNRTIYEEIRVDKYYGVGIYRVKSDENDKYNKIHFDIGESGGEIDCYDKIENTYLGNGQIYMKNQRTSEYYIRFNFMLPDLTENQNRMKCNVIHKFKDLSLFNINLMDSRYSSIDKTIIWSNVGYFLKELHFFDHIEDKYIFLCGGGENNNNANINNNIIYTTYTFTLAKSINSEVINSFNINNLGDIKFTTSAGPRNNAICFLLSYVNGKPIGPSDDYSNNEEESYKVLMSDLHLRFHIEGNNPYTLSYLLLAEPEEKTHLTRFSDMIYDVVGIEEYNYNIHKPGGEMLCYDDSHHRIKSFVLGILTNNKNYYNSNEYYIQYPDLEEIPSPRNYHCMKTVQYNDMSLFQLKCDNLYDNNGCTELYFKVMYPVLLSMGFDVTGRKKLLCHLPKMQNNISRVFDIDFHNKMRFSNYSDSYNRNYNNNDNENENDDDDDGSEIVKEYEAEITGSVDAIFHILHGVRLAYGTVCHLMTNIKGENIPVSQSDLKLNNLIYKKSSSNRWLYYKNKQHGGMKLYDAKPIKISAIEAINIIIRPDTPNTSGMIECSDIETKEYLGNGFLYGKDSKGNLIIQFNFEFGSRTVEDIIIEVNNPFNDLSNLPIDKLTDENCYYNKKMKKYDCILKLNGLYDLLNDKGFYNENNNDTYLFACQNDKDIYQYRFELIRKTTNLKDVEFEFVESVYEDSPELPANFTCHLLSTIEGKRLSLNESDYGRNTFCTKPNKCQIGICQMNDNSNYCVKIADESSILQASTKMSITKEKEIFDEIKPNGYSNNPMIQYSKEITKCIQSKLSSSVLILPLPEEYRDLWNFYIAIGKVLTLTTVETPSFKVSVQILSLLGVSSESDVGECTGGPRYLFSEGKVRESNPNIRDSLMVKISKDIDVSRIDGKQLVVIFGSKTGRSGGNGGAGGSGGSGGDDESVESYEPHKEIECSGAGTCDRSTGLCKCYDGFEGYACERISCPNNCNGNGRCVSLKELLRNPSELSRYQGYGNIYSIPFNGDSEYDDTKMVVSDRIYGCLCDKRYRGSDCSLMECPSGNDPLNPDEENGEKRDCSGRGLCNYKTGQCECFEGFDGEACEIRNVYV